MAAKRKIIITCAVTGSIHTPSMSPYLPATSDEISDASIQAADAGAAIIHLHARKPEDGRPSQDPEDFAPMIEKINASSEAVINLTSGGSPHMSVEERMQPAMTFAPELASLNMGSMNFGLFPMLKRFHRARAPVGARSPGEQPGPHLQEHLLRHRDDPHARHGERHAVRVRVL